MEGTDWIPITFEEVDILHEAKQNGYIRQLVTMRDHLFRTNDTFSWHRLESDSKPAKDAGEAVLRGIVEVNERSARKGGGWMPQWNEMNGEERREYLTFLEEKARSSEPSR